MPNPKKNEKKEDFISRCVSSEEAQKTFPDQKQRVAFCYSKWSEHTKAEDVANAMYSAKAEKKISPYGRCPTCKADGIIMERRPNGNVTCKNNHVHPRNDMLD